MTLRIVTRQSPLALWQANTVKSALEAEFPDIDVTLIGVVTDGDRWLDKPLYELGGKSLFVSKLEEYLLEGKADVAVHSMKDLPAALPEGLSIEAVLPRGNPFDAWISRDHETLTTLPVGARVGTGSLRRQAQLKKVYPHLEMVPLRGNVGTRLEKLDEENLAGIVLAAAGLERLGLSHRIASTLPVNDCLPAVGQGIMGIECRTDDAVTKACLAALHHLPTWRQLQAERAMNAVLNGGCHVPIAGYATLDEGHLRMEGRVLSLDGTRSYRAVAEGPMKQAQDLGASVGEALLAQGAGRELS